MTTPTPPSPQSAKCPVCGQLIGLTRGEILLAHDSFTSNHGTGLVGYICPGSGCFATPQLPDASGQEKEPVAQIFHREGHVEIDGVYFRADVAEVVRRALLNLDEGKALDTIYEKPLPDPQATPEDFLWRWHNDAKFHRAVEELAQSYIQPLRDRHEQKCETLERAKLAAEAERDKALKIVAQLETKVEHLNEVLAIYGRDEP